MSNPLSDLQQLLAGRVSIAGKIISTANGVARVATSAGMVEVATDGVAKVGDRVTVQNGRAIRVQDAMDVPVFFV